EEIIRDLEWLGIELYVSGQQGYWASLRIEHDLISRIKEAQKEDSEIWTIVENLDKQVEFRLDDDNVSAHFLPIRKDYSVSRLAEIFQQEIVRLHGTPSAIVSDRDPRFASRFWKGSRLAEIFQQEIVRLPGTPSAIVSDRDPRFPSHFWKGLQKAWGTRLKFSTAFHPQTNGQSERTIQTLEGMLCSCALEWSGNWDDYICLVEFSYNNSWHASIKCAPFEMLYGRKCRAPICWDQVGERVIEGPEMIEVTNAKVAVAKEKLKEA
nr:putative nucleotidyltransferase, ribonuclease H [Tanacetum cinerariifolium]